MVQNARKMLSGRRHDILKAGTATAALVATVLSATLARAQDAPVVLAQAEPAPKAAPNPERPPSEVSSFVGSLIPGFRFNAAVNLEETYATNATGYSSGGSQDDFITLAGVSLDMHEHSRRVSMDAMYNGQVYYYAKGGQQTQFTNDLQALANVIAIPDYLNVIGRAFAQPVVVSNSGFATASGIVGPDGYRNSYGYSIGPDFTLKLGDFADSDTTATYGAAYFTQPNGYTGTTLIPGVTGPENVTQRNASETLKSGSDFVRLTWVAQAQFSEMDRSQGLFSDKSGVVTLAYKLTSEVAVLGTGGYDKVSNTLGLNTDVSGPVGMGGVQVTIGPDFKFMAEAGQKYNSFSFLGTLRWSITATSSLTGEATDTVSTPEGQMLDSLSNLTSSLNGTLVPSNGIYADGSTSSLAAFTAQSLGSLSYTQNIARFRRVSLTYALDFERDHGNVQVFGEKRTQLDKFFVGPPVANSWGAQATYGHNISRLTTLTLGAGYIYYQELGGHANTYDFTGEVDYSLGPLTRVYFRTGYYRRDSSDSLQRLSPVTGSLDDVRLTIGLTHQL